MVETTQYAAPYREIERVYGSNGDDFGDAVVEVLNRICEWPGQYRCRWIQATEHPNPYFHELLLEVDGLSGAKRAEFERGLEALPLRLERRS